MKINWNSNNERTDRIYAVCFACNTFIKYFIKVLTFLKRRRMLMIEIATVILLLRSGFGVFLHDQRNRLVVKVKGG